MALTETQIAERTNYIGASDVPVIVMGDSYPWKRFTNTKTLFLEKTGRKAPYESNAATRAGDIMEYSLMFFANTSIGRLKRDKQGHIIRDEEIVHPNGVMRCHLDGTFLDMPYLCEFKSTGQTNSFYEKDRWGKSETTVDSPDQCSSVLGFDADKAIFSQGTIPLEYYWQIQAQLSCYNARCRQKPGKYPAVIGVILVVNLPGTNEPFRFYRVMANPHSIATLEQMVCSFNDQYLVPDVAPPAPLTPSTLDELVLDNQQQGTVSNKTMNALRKAEKARRDANAAAEAADVAYKAALAKAFDEGGPYTTLASPNGEWVIRNTSIVTPQAERKPYPRTIHQFSWKESNV